jgi:hypothetical protein
MSAFRKRGQEHGERQPDNKPGPADDVDQQRRELRRERHAPAHSRSTDAEGEAAPGDRTLRNHHGIRDRRLNTAPTRPMSAKIRKVKTLSRAG